MGNVISDMKTLKTEAINQKHCKRNKAFDELISSLGMAEERITELEESHQQKPLRVKVKEKNEWKKKKKEQIV